MRRWGGPSSAGCRWPPSPRCSSSRSSTASCAGDRRARTFSPRRSRVMPESKTGWGALIGVTLLVALLVIGIVPRLRDQSERVAAATAPDAGLVTVSVATPRRADGPSDLLLPSNVQAIEEAAIYSRTSGYVRERYVDIGDRVAAGKALAQIDTPELDQELSQARAALAQTRSGLAQARATTAVSQANVDAMQANLGALEASVEAAQANVAANEANVQRLKALQSFQRVEAPFAGIITARGIDRGALITSGSGSGSIALFRIAHVENLRIFVNVPQTFVRSIVPGQEVQILVPEYPQRPFVGKIASTAGALDPTSRTLLTEVRLRNDDHALMPGMYAQVKFSLVPADAVWVVPATALITRAAGPQVIAVHRDGTVHLVGVQLGRDLGQSVEIVSGLTGQERLVVSPPDGLKDGARVVAEEIR